MRWVRMININISLCWPYIRSGEDDTGHQLSRLPQGARKNWTPSDCGSVGFWKKALKFFLTLIHRPSRSSTLENWCREFARFAPSIAIQTYYADKNERPFLRETLLNSQKCRNKASDGWEVLITTYNLAQGDDRDRKFFRKIEWDVRRFFYLQDLKNNPI